MELSTRGRYAVMALADIGYTAASTANPAPVALSAVAERQGLSTAYLEQIFMHLRRAGIVVSARGRNGGYRLARAPSDIFVVEIFDAVSVNTTMTRCIGAAGGGGCRGPERCLTHNFWDALGQQIRAFAASVSLQDVLDGGPQVGHTLQRMTGATGARPGKAGRP